MKVLMMAMMVMVSMNAFAGRPAPGAHKAHKTAKKVSQKTVCEKLNEKADANCRESLCEEFWNNAQTCPSEDLDEAVQGCMDGEFGDVLKEYNDQHGTNLTCEG